jgi:lipopolysaccharide export system protein LptC
MIYRIFAGLIFIAVVVGTIMFGGQQNENTAPTLIEEPHSPGYAAHGAKLVQTGSDGHRLYTVDAEVIRQLPNDNSIELTRPTLGFYDANGNRWTARGERGEVGQNTGIVKLSENVQVNGTPQGTQPAQILTNHLSLDTNSKVASTKDPVTLTWSGQEIRAHGMRASLNDGRVQLESAVRGTAVPSKLPGSQK